jgi:hypothetical protein
MKTRSEHIKLNEIVGGGRCKWAYNVLIVKDTRITKLLVRCSPTGERRSGSTKEKMEKSTSKKKGENGICYNLYLTVIMKMLS